MKIKSDIESGVKYRKVKVEDDDKLLDGLEESSKYSRGMRLLFCFSGLMISYISWGISQERIMTKEYSFGKFTSSAFCVFGNRFLALFISLTLVGSLYINPETKELIKPASAYVYLPSSISNSLSSWAQYESLKFLTFPTQTLSKSCKLIPVMLMGYLLNNKSYRLVDYMEALIISLGVGTFTIAEKSPKHGSGQNDSLIGITLIIVYLFCDSFTSQWQSRIYKRNRVHQFQMQLGVNIWSLTLTGAALIYTGEGFDAFSMIMQDREALFDTCILSFTSAIGQLFIFHTIKEFGAKTFTIMMTTRQMLSMIFSCILFGHSIGMVSLAGACIVFAIIFNRIYLKSSD